MAKLNTYVQSFNTGVQDKTALPRTDLERMRLASEVQTNLMCRATGPGFMRPGTEYLLGAVNNNECLLKEFIFGATDAALFEFSDSQLRVLVNDAPIVRNAVSSSIFSGDFSSSAGWTTTGVNGGVASITGGQLILTAPRVESIGRCYQSTPTSSPGIEHAVRIVVTRGPVTFRCGTFLGGDEYIPETILETGTHSLAFTPIADYFVQLEGNDVSARTVDSIMIEPAGQMMLPTPWLVTDLPNIRVDQSADVCFVACLGRQQRRIERRGLRSWSVVLYKVNDGPFPAPADQKIRLTPAGLNGDVFVNASAPCFYPSDVGSLLRLDLTGQNTNNIVSLSDTYGDTIRVTGIVSATNDRDFTIVLSGTWTGKITLERSYDSDTSGFNPVKSWTANTTETYSDGDDNSIYWYRLGFEPGDYGSGAATIQLSYPGGGGYGICRINTFTSSLQVGVEILRPFTNTLATKVWRRSEWSDKNGWPSAVALSDGRLWWSGADRIWGSVSDAFASFDEEVEGDSGPISRSIATGGVNNTQWILSLLRLLVGTEGAVATVKSSSLDEPLTPTNFGIKDSSSTGSAAIAPAKIDTRGIIVERAGKSLLELNFDGGSSDYKASEISKLTTDIFSSGIKQLAVQRRPDTRIWIVLNDGSAICMVYEADDAVLAFIPIETDGLIESIAVLPALQQDRVYFSVNRTINAASVRYIEKMAMDTEVKPTTLCKVMDAFNSGTNSPASATLNVGTHLIGESVVVWADGAPIETSRGVPAAFTVDVSGNITLPSAVTDWVAGLPYTAQYKSARLAYGAQGGTAMLQKKTVDELGLIITDFVRSGIRYGHSFTDPYRGLFPMPEMADGKTQPNIVLSAVHDEEAFTFPGEWNTDSRVCMQVSSPYTATFLGMVMTLSTNG